MGSRHVLIAVANIYDTANEHSMLGVSFFVASEKVKGNLLVGVPKSVYTGNGILDVARDQLRLFAGSLADATVSFAMTEDQIRRSRKDYQPDPLRR